MMLLSQDDVFLRWMPGVKGEFITFAHPAPKTPKPDMTPVASFGGYPLVKTPNGVVIADDNVNPFFALISGLTSVQWHRDYLHRAGVPAVSGNTIFSGVGGDNALGGIMALDARSGETSWFFEPTPLPREPIVAIDAVTKRDLTPDEKAELRYADQMIARAGGARLATKTDVTVVITVPVINAQHGHWFNPGLVTAKGRVYGQVGPDIVALAQDSGIRTWNYVLGAGEQARSIAASATHLFVSLDNRVIALDLENGTLAWTKEMPRAGTLTIAGGRVFLAMGTASLDGKEGGEIVAFEPVPKDPRPEAGKSTPPPSRR
jgi:hypothetical protein